MGSAVQEVAVLHSVPELVLLMPSQATVHWPQEPPHLGHGKKGSQWHAELLLEKQTAQTTQLLPH